jgi:hypothetical protein
MERWNDDIKARRFSLKEKEVPIDIFFNKIVMLRDPFACNGTKNKCA